MSVIDRLTDKDKQELALLAVKASKDLGYCSEAVNVLDQMGLSAGDNEVEIVLTVRVSLPFHIDPDDLDVDTLRFQDSDYETYDGDVYDIKVSK